jgi:D-glycero-alpha-D-manno-heptose-7-phosphate kinase
VVGGKLVGAGGGGFLLVYARNPADTRQAMAAAGAPELPFDFEFVGAYSSENA